MLDKKRIIIISLFVIGILLVILGAYFFIKHGRKVEFIEYTPQEEITESQFRQSMVSLYFKGEKGLTKEIRLIDVRELIDNPYEKIFKMLLEGPKSEDLKNVIPEGTKINKIEKEGENLVLDLSEEFISNHIGGEQEEKHTIEAIVYTLTELNEINGIKIKINGEDNKEFKDGIVKFNQIFTKDCF